MLLLRLYIFLGRSLGEVIGISISEFRMETQQRVAKNFPPLAPVSWLWDEEGVDAQELWAFTTPLLSPIPHSQIPLMPASDHKAVNPTLQEVQASGITNSIPTRLGTYYFLIQFSFSPQFLKPEVDFL